MDVTILVTTMGDASWERLAWSVAIPDALKQTGAFTASMHVSDDVSLGEARNRAVEFHDPKGWICFLDADDRLEPGFVDAMQAVHQPRNTDLLAPALRIVSETKPDPPVEVLKHRDMARMNSCPIGTLIHRTQFDAVGGFWDEPIWEDWSLFRRCWLTGSRIRHIDGAVYRATHSPAGRNSQSLRGIHSRIIKSHEKWLNQ